MRNFILAATVAALGFGVAVAADAPAKPAAAPAGKALTDADLFGMIENMGFEVMVRPDEKAEVKRMTVRVTRGDFPIDIPMTVNLSGDKGTLYLFVNLADLTEAELGNAAGLQKLLELNDVSGKNQFRINPKTKQLWLARFTDNANLTPAALKRHIELLATTVVETRDQWDTKKWAKADGEAAKK